MGSTIKIEVRGLDNLIGLLDNEPKNQLDAMVKAQTKLATQAVAKLKSGLSHNGGRGKNAEPSPKGEMPYLHTGRLRNSIGYRTKTKNANAETQVGSGAMGNPIEYAKYLQGRNGDGLRPFLWAVKDLVTPDRLIAYFKEFWKPLQRGK
jgi:hypothetical protein